MSPFASTRSGVPSRERSTQEAPQPALPAAAERNAGRPLSNAGAPSPVCVGAAQDGVRLPPRVRHEEVEPAVAVVVARRDAHARVRVGDSFRDAPLLEAEAEAGRIGGGAARPGDVLVQLVRVLVVRDVQVGPAVAVVVREDRAEAVAEVARPRALPARRPRGTSRGRGVVPLVQVEEVAHAGVARREATDRASRSACSSRCSRRRRDRAGRRRSRPRPPRPYASRTRRSRPPSRPR